VDFVKSSPRHKPFNCCAAWHLRKSGSLLSVYDLVAQITSGGRTKFFATIAHVTRYFYPEVADNPEAFQSKYEIVRKNFAVLRKLGWLKMREDGDHDFVTHADWAKAHKNCCNVRELLPWQIETDPLVAKLYAISGGKLRLMENYVVGLRKVATDEELVNGYSVSMTKAQQLRDQGHYAGTSPRAVMHSVYKHFQQRSRQIAISRGSNPNIGIGSKPNTQFGTNPT
jgi:hypothetical protein